MVLSDYWGIFTENETSYPLTIPSVKQRNITSDFVLIEKKLIC